MYRGVCGQLLRLSRPSGTLEPGEDARNHGGQISISCLEQVVYLPRSSLLGLTVDNRNELHPQPLDALPPDDCRAEVDNPSFPNLSPKKRSDPQQNKSRSPLNATSRWLCPPRPFLVKSPPDPCHSTATVLPLALEILLYTPNHDDKSPTSICGGTGFAIPDASRFLCCAPLKNAGILILSRF
jgi:hypothetical protein